ncbi:MAG: hypothetical protein OEZ01_01075 [Candidatus Heimdallarchaeota archaeon]|nr:hypothetical protein [Candidatus Heimdallarchaeota archaeon]
MVWLERFIVFTLILSIFFPLLNKVVRLASRTWDNREYLERERVIKTVFIAPLLVFFVFILVYYGVIIILDVLVLEG